MNEVPAAAPAWRGGWTQGLRYGALGLPLAFVALPLYVVLPNHYATEFGIPLATLGALLLGARLLDAVADPWIGRWVDSLFAQNARRVLGVAVVAACVLALGFRGLFFPPVQGVQALLVWCAALLAVTYLSYSVLSVLHQAWGARLGGDEGQRARIVSWREGLGLLGVLLLAGAVAALVSVVAGPHAAWLSTELRVWAVVYPIYLLAVVRPITSMWRFLLLDLPVGAVLASMAVRGTSLGRPMSRYWRWRVAATLVAAVVAMSWWVGVLLTRTPWNDSPP